MKVFCPVCGKRVGAYVPAGGDGSGVRIRKHNHRAFVRTTLKVQCEGSFEVVAPEVETVPLDRRRRAGELPPAACGEHRPVRRR